MIYHRTVVVLKTKIVLEFGTDEMFLKATFCELC